MDDATGRSAPDDRQMAGASPWRAPEPETGGRAAGTAPQPAWQAAPPQQQAWQPQPQPQPTWQQQPQPSTWQQPPSAPWLAEPQGNPVAVWSWVVAVPCALLGLVLGILGLVRARRRGGAGLAHAVVGTALSGVVLLVSAGALAAGAAAGVAALAEDTGEARVPDGTVAEFSEQEQAFIDDLYEDTYQSFDDATLLDMARGFCSDMDGGASPQEADAALVERWSGDDLDLDTAYDVEWSATDTLCPQHAEEFQAWDPAATDGDGTSSTTTTTTVATTTTTTTAGVRQGSSRG